MKLSHVFRAPFVEFGRNLHRSVPITRSVLNGAIWSLAERGQIGQVIEEMVGTRRLELLTSTVSR